MPENGGSVGMPTANQFTQHHHDRSFSLNPCGTALVRTPGVVSTVVGTIDILGEGKEPLYEYLLPDGRVWREIFVAGLCLGLVGLDGQLVAESLIFHGCRIIPEPESVAVSAA